MTTNEHDHNDPLAFLNAIEAAWLASDSTIPRCPHCQEERHMLPMSGNGWGVEIAHEPHCPSHEDNQPAYEVDFNDERSGGSEPWRSDGSSTSS